MSKVSANKTSKSGKSNSANVASKSGKASKGAKQAPAAKQAAPVDRSFTLNSMGRRERVATSLRSSSSYIDELLEARGGKGASVADMLAYRGENGKITRKTREGETVGACGGESRIRPHLQRLLREGKARREGHNYVQVARVVNGELIAIGAKSGKSKSKARKAS